MIILVAYNTLIYVLLFRQSSLPHMLAEPANAHFVHLTPISTSANIPSAIKITLTSKQKNRINTVVCKYSNPYKMTIEAEKIYITPPYCQYPLILSQPSSPTITQQNFSLYQSLSFSTLDLRP
jgi:hypothetical protein